MIDFNGVDAPPLPSPLPAARRERSGAQLTIRAGRAYMVTQPERQAALDELRERLSAGGVSVDLQIQRYIPGRRGLPPPWSPEEVSVYIEAGVSTVVVKIANDVYDAAKKWAKKRYDRKRKEAADAGKDPDRVNGEKWIIYGPDGKILKTGTIDKEGEHEEDGEQ